MIKVRNRLAEYNYLKCNINQIHDANNVKLQFLHNEILTASFINKVMLQNISQAPDVMSITLGPNGPMARKSNVFPGISVCRHLFWTVSSYNGISTANKYLQFSS